MFEHCSSTLQPPREVRKRHSERVQDSKIKAPGDKSLARSQKLGTSLAHAAHGWQLGSIPYLRTSTLKVQDSADSLLTFRGQQPPEFHLTKGRNWILSFSIRCEALKSYQVQLKESRTKNQALYSVSNPLEDNYLTAKSLVHLIQNLLRQPSYLIVCRQPRLVKSKDYFTFRVSKSSITHAVKTMRDIFETYETYSGLHIRSCSQGEVMASAQISSEVMETQTRNGFLHGQGRPCDQFAKGRHCRLQ